MVDAASICHLDFCGFCEGFTDVACGLLVSRGTSADMEFSLNRVLTV